MINEDKIIYLYCITEEKPDLSDTKKISENVYFLQIDNFYALLETVDEDDFGDTLLHENIKNVEWLSKHATYHEKIIESVMLKGANVIPFKFATLFYNHENVSSALIIQQNKISDNFRKLKNKEEWGVKIFCNKECLLEDILRTNTEIKNLNTEIESSNPGKAYILKKKKQELLKNVLSNEINEAKIKYFNELKNFSKENKINKTQPREITGRKEEMILNAVFLIGKKEISHFIDKLLTYKNNNKTFIFEYTGPWPPYNFL